MKKIILLFVSVFISSFSIFAQTPSWIWANSAGGKQTDEGNAITTDAAGYIYAAGYFTSPTITLGNLTLTNSDSTGYTTNAYIVKYSPSGNAIWARKFNDNSPDIAYGITTDSQSNIYVTGDFDSDTIYFGASTLISLGGADIFIAKFDSSGNALWAKSAGGPSLDYANSITTDVTGNVFITGTFVSSSIYFDSINIKNVGTGCSAYDVFVAKYSSAGKLLWAKGAGGIGADMGRGVATDLAGNVYVTGQFNSPSIAFGNDSLTNISAAIGAKILTSDIFLAKYDPDGNVLWVKGAGGSLNDYACGIATLNSDVYITGAFASDSITFDTLYMTKPFINNYNVFVTKYDTAGNAIWARQPICNKIIGDNIGNSINVSSNGKISVTGVYADSAVSFGSTTLLDSGYNDIFVAQYDISGNVQWAISAGGNNNDNSACITKDPNGYIYITGNFSDSVLVFGNIPALVYAGGQYIPPDVFIAKLNPGISVGIDAIPDQKNNVVNIFPNPTSDRFTVTVPASSTEIKIFNSLGQIISLIKTSGETKESFSINECGIYFIIVSSANGIMTKKVVIYK